MLVGTKNGVSVRADVFRANVVLLIIVRANVVGTNVIKILFSKFC